MKNAFRVRYTAGAREDLTRLFDFLLQQCQSVEDLEKAQQALDAICDHIENRLGSTPLIYRKASESPFLRELIISWGASGYVALYEVEGADTVSVLAVRHHREDDYH